MTAKKFLIEIRCTQKTKYVWERFLTELKRIYGKNKVTSEEALLELLSNHELGKKIILEAEKVF